MAKQFVETKWNKIFVYKHINEKNRWFAKGTNLRGLITLPFVPQSSGYIQDGGILVSKLPTLKILVAFFRSLFVDTFPPAPKFLTSFKPPERGANSFLHCSNFPMLGNHICSKFAKILQVGRARTIKDSPSPHLRDDIDSCILIKDFKNYYNINSIAAPRATLTPLSCWPSQMPEVYPGRRGGGGRSLKFRFDRHI